MFVSSEISEPIEPKFRVKILLSWGKIVIKSGSVKPSDLKLKNRLRATRRKMGNKRVDLSEFKIKEGV